MCRNPNLTNVSFLEVKIITKFNTLYSKLYF